MIIENGTIQIVERKGGGMENGNPVKVTETLSDPIPCNFTTNQNDHLGRYEGGTFTQAKYVVLIDTRDFAAEYVVLATVRGERLGQFRVQDIQFLDVVGNVKITVE
jgi:hypothetical protein